MADKVQFGNHVEMCGKQLKLEVWGRDPPAVWCVLV